MDSARLVVISDRGGHLHDALCLVRGMGIRPMAWITTPGPDTEFLRDDPAQKGARFFVIPQAFSWIGKLRLWNPLRFAWLVLSSLAYVLLLRPTAVVSTGASNVVIVCYFARLAGAKVYHVENLNQVTEASITGRLLYPVCHTLFVQWEDLLPLYGKKAQYRGWVV